MENILEYVDFLNETKRKSINRGSSNVLTLRYIGRNGGSRTQRDFGGYFNYILLEGSTKVLCLFSIQCDNNQKYLQIGNKATLQVYSNRNERDDFQRRRASEKPLKDIIIPIGTNYEIYSPEQLRKSGELIRSNGGFNSIKQVDDSVYIKIYGILFPADLSLSTKIIYGHLSREEKMEAIKGLMIQEIYKKTKDWTVSHTHKYIREFLPSYNGKNGELDEMFNYILKYTDISIEEIVEEFRLDKIYPDLSQYL